MRLLSFLLALLFVVALLLPAQAADGQELPLTHYTQESDLNPLPSADIRSVYQDRLGYLWILAYSSGLLRYDGHSLDRYTVQDGLTDLGVRQALEDRQGRLWVGSDAGLVVSEKPLGEYAAGERCRFTRRIDSVLLMGTTVIQNRMAVDNRGWIWVGTREDGIIRYRMNDQRPAEVDTIRTDLSGSGKNKDIRSLTVRKDGTVWAAVGGGDLLVFPSAEPRFAIVSDANGAPRSSTEILYETSGGLLVGGCRNGAAWMLLDTPGRREIKVFNSDLRNSITCITEAPAGTLWIASDGSGTLRLPCDSANLLRPAAEQARAHYTTANGFLSDNVSNVLQDREMDIWFTQLGGISKLRANYRAFENLSATPRGGDKPVLPNPGVDAVIPPATPSGTLWVGTSGGGVAAIGGKNGAAFIQAAGGLSNDWINGLVQDAAGRLWIGTTQGINCLVFGGGVPPNSSRIRPFTLFGKQGKLAAYGNTTMYTSRDLAMKERDSGSAAVESIWFPGYQILYCFAGDTWFVFRSASGLPATFINDVAFDDTGRLLVGTRDAGLWRSRTVLSLAAIGQLRLKDIDPALPGNAGIFGREVMSAVFEPIWNQSAGAPSNQVQRLAWKDGSLWVATPNGLSQLEGDPPALKATLTTGDGLNSDNVGSMAFSPVDGMLWVGTNAGLAAIDPKSRRVVRTVTKQDGLADDEVWFYGSVDVGGDGTVYFGNAKGLSLYHPDLDTSNTMAPPLRLEEARFTEDNRGHNEIAFGYAALSFANEKLVRYRTRLVGYDTGWSAEKTDVKIRYTNLPAFLAPKTYAFEVIACNNNGLWSPAPLSYTFSVRPPWWFRWWAFVLNVGGLIVIGTLFNRHRIKQLQRRGRELEHIVDQRTQQIRHQADELAGKNKELEEKNLKIIQTQEQLITQEKLASLGALTAGIAHEIKNPLNFVNNFAELSVELLGELREDLEKSKDRLGEKEFRFIGETLDDLQHNATKINEHGKRADSIVRGMLLHSRGSTGERTPTDLNELLDEHVDLAYHGIRGQDPNFNITIVKEYDETIGAMDIIPQDLSRVFLNVVNNACYAANEKKTASGDAFTPTLTVRTKNLGDRVEIRIRDNGNGIRKDIIDKIFQPFFTTKPTGKGTGLGLSLSYDIVVKEHNGELVVESEPGSYAEFIIRLPKQPAAPRGS